MSPVEETIWTRPGTEDFLGPVKGGTGVSEGKRRSISEDLDPDG
jgi:hypothetical protein